jgi:hypothetical protein
MVGAEMSQLRSPRITKGRSAGPPELPPPNLAITLPLDRYAPRAARHHVALVDSPSPDLRDAIVLLTSELVSRVVEHSWPGAGDAFELRVWMPPEVVRVEVRAPRPVLGGRQPAGAPDFDHLLFGHLADRWSGAVEGESEQSTWFEIDRVRPRVASHG